MLPCRIQSVRAALGTLLPRCRTDVLPSSLSLSLPYVARREPAPAGKQGSPQQLSVFIPQSPCPIHVPSFLHPFVKERCWMYRLLNFRSARSVQRNFFHVICTRGPLAPMPSIQGQKYFIPLSGCLGALGSSTEEYYAVYHSIRFE